MTNKLILGTVQFGLNYGINNPHGKPSEGQIAKILDYAYNHGLTILDTADAYGNATKIIGNYNIKSPNKFKINTKFKGNESHIEDQLDSSLCTLNADFVNIYFYHSFDDFVRYPDLKTQLLDLKEQRKIKKM